VPTRRRFGSPRGLRGACHRAGHSGPDPLAQPTRYSSLRRRPSLDISPSISYMTNHRISLTEGRIPDAIWMRSECGARARSRKPFPGGSGPPLGRHDDRPPRSSVANPGYASTRMPNASRERTAFSSPARSAGGGDHPKGGGGACGADDSLGMRRTCCDVRLLAASPASGISLGVRASWTVFIRCRLDPGSVIKRMPVFADFRIHQPSHAVDHTQRFMFRQTVPGIER
jgi:hypothetical protein